jgi:ribosome-binding protein aMBF1 (putative translation factor)
VKFSHTLRKRKQDKPLPDDVKTLGDWIRVKRIEKNLTPGHLALKMGIASALVCSWEDDNSQPDTRQLEILANLLGIVSFPLLVQSQ